MKIELLLNLENFQNITFISNDDKDRLDAYEELLPCVEDWVGYTPYALNLVNRIRKILSLDPYEVENGVQDEQFTKETIEINEEVLMDLTEVTIIALTDKAVLFTKKGYQKWVPFSTLESGVPLEEGGYLEDIELTDQGAKWIPNKAWEKLKVVKK